MSTSRFVLWCILCAISAGLMLFLESFLRRKGTKALQVLFLLLRVVSIPLLGLLLVYWDFYITWVGNLQLGALYVGAFGTVLGDLSAGAVKLTRRFLRKPGAADIPEDNSAGDPESDRKMQEAGRKSGGERIPAIGERSRRLTAAVCVLGLFLYGTWNAMAASPKNYTYTSPKLNREYKLIFASDMHTGSTQRFATIRKNLEKAAAEQPDLLILGGDLTDEFTTKEQMETFYEIVGSLGVPTVAIYGNHDRQLKSDKVGGRTYSDEELLTAMEKNGVRLLCEEYLELGEDLVLLGREDLSNPEGRVITDASGNPSPESMLLVLDHQQLTEESLQAVSGDLQLSGHSHAGQYFPLRFIYELAGANPCGEYTFGTSKLYVSSGISGWRIPFRTEERCHYEIITLKPE